MSSSGSPVSDVNRLQASQWRFTRATPGSGHLGQFDTDDHLSWQSAHVPGTVASNLIDGTVRGGLHYPALDASDWIFATTFPADPDTTAWLNCHGLAGICEVWLNGQHLLSTDNMFRCYTQDVSEHLRADNQLCLVFRSVDTFLGQRFPRPRWKTRLVDHQDLRFLRRTLLGRIPGWTPNLPAIGPWQAVELIQRQAPWLDHFAIRTHLDEHAASVRLRGTLHWCDSGTTPPVLRATINSTDFDIPLQQGADGWQFDRELVVSHVQRWWPHTHGEQGSNPCALTLTHGGESITLRTIDLRFKSLAFEQNAATSRFVINGVSVFARGACWTVADLRRLQHDADKVARILQQMKTAGMNMLRIGGTMLYEHDAFYKQCDELGIMVWQDLMFANMDYPFDDAAFRNNVETEIQQQLARLSRFGCIVSYCGGSEIEQQAAMTGIAADQQAHPFLRERLPQLCGEWHRGIPCFSSSPTGGAMPFFTSEGITHYYGVGAYQRDFSDLFVADVKFATECLAFSNVPQQSHLKRHFDSLFPAPHGPDWKASVCRDNGSGWDFEDVRDHYVRELFGVDPIALRYADLERYYAYAEVATGDVMSRVFQFWRSSLSRCSGGLIWFLNDLVPGGGWGVIDSDGDAKPALNIAAQALQTVQLVLVNKGLEGFWLEAINESAIDRSGRLIVQLWRDNRVEVARGEMPLSVKRGEQRGLLIEQVLGHFYDTANAYRFGPVKHQLITARWLNDDGELLSQAVAYSDKMRLPMVTQTKLQATLSQCDGQWQLLLCADTFLQHIDIRIKGFRPQRNRLNLLPDQTYIVTLARYEAVNRLRGEITALNSETVYPVAITTTG